MAERAKTPAIRFDGFTGAWQQRKLGEIGSIVTGTTPSTAIPEYYSKDGIPWVTPTDITENITFDTERRLSPLGQEIARVVPVNTILVTCIASIGKNTILGTTGSFNQQINGLIPNESKYDPYFLFAESALWSAKMKRSAAAGTMQIVNRTEFSELKTWIPNREEQVQIGAYFRALDEIIALHQRKYEKLVNIKKSMLGKMFPRGGAAVPEIRFAGFTGAWQQRKLGEIVERGSAIGTDNALPRVEYEDIISGTGRLNKDIYAKESNKAGLVFHAGDVLYGKLRPYLKNWLLPSFSGLAVGDFWVLQPQKVDSRFLYSLIQSNRFNEVANQSTGTKMPRADWKLVSKTEFAIPSSLEEQGYIGQFLLTLDDIIALYRQKSEKLKNIKRSFLEKMFA